MAVDQTGARPPGEPVIDLREHALEETERQYERSHRGVLVISPAATRAVVQGALREHFPDARMSSLDLGRTDAHGVAFACTVALPYPERPLGEVLTEIRRRLGEEVGRLLGRPVVRVDLVVDRFVGPAPAGRRVE